MSNRKPLFERLFLYPLFPRNDKGEYNNPNKKEHSHYLRIRFLINDGRKCNGNKPGAFIKKL